jgi:hypothetical protein
MGKGAGERGHVMPLDVAHRRVGAARAGGAGDYVPQTDVRGEEGGEAVFITKGGQVAPGSGRDQPPELVLGVGIIAPLGQRAFARQRAENEQADTRVDDGREAVLAFAHKAAVTSVWTKSSPLKSNGSPVALARA